MRKRKHGMQPHVVPLFSDMTPERARHAGGHLDDSWIRQGRQYGARIVTVYDRDPVERLFMSGALDWRQKEAASKLRMFAHRLHLDGAISSVDFDAVRSTDPMRFGNLPEFARKQFNLALDLLTPDECRVVRICVILSEPLSAAATSTNGRGIARVEALLGSSLRKMADLWL